MSIPQEIQDRVNARMKVLLDKVRKHYPNLEVPPIKITYQPSGRTAGWAKCHMMHINLHGGLMLTETDEMINETLGHELAHIIVWLVYNKASNYTLDPSAHGDEWKRMMRVVMEQTPSRLHDMDTTEFRREMTRYKYSCDCPGKVHEMSTKSHAAIQAGTRYFVCDICKYQLKFAEDHVHNKWLPDSLQHATKKRKATFLINMFFDRTRAEVIKILIDGAGCTPAGASTYYASIKKEIESDREYQKTRVLTFKQECSTI